MLGLRKLLLCVALAIICAGQQQQQRSLQPEATLLVANATVAGCSDDSACGEHGICAIEEGACFCDLGYSGKTCAVKATPGAARGSTDVHFWQNLSLSSVRGPASSATSMMGLLGAPSAAATNWFNPFANVAQFNPFAQAAAAAKQASRSVINPFAAPPQGAINMMAAPSMQLPSPIMAVGGLPASPWGFGRR